MQHHLYSQCQEAGAKKEGEKKKSSALKATVILILFVTYIFASLPKPTRIMFDIANGKMHASEKLSLGFA